MKVKYLGPKSYVLKGQFKTYEFTEADRGAFTEVDDTVAFNLAMQKNNFEVNEAEVVKEESVKVDLDINKDGKVDEKDRSLMAKALSSVKKPRKKTRKTVKK